MTNIETITNHLKGQTIEHNHHTFTIKNIEWALGYPSERLNVSVDVTYRNEDQSLTLSDFDGHFAYMTESNNNDFDVVQLDLTDQEIKQFKSQLFNNIIDGLIGSVMSFESIKAIVNNAFYHVNRDDRNIAGTLIVVPYESINIGAHFNDHTVEGIYIVEYNDDWYSATGKRIGSVQDLPHTDDYALLASQAIYESLKTIDSTLETKDLSHVKGVIFNECY